MIRATLLGLALSAGPLFAQDVMMEDGGPGYPPKMGEISGFLGKEAVAWETFDFSIGAFDASAWVNEYNGVVTLRLMGYPPGQPQIDTGRVLISADMGKALKKRGKSSEVEIEIYRDEDRDGPRLSNKGKAGRLKITRLKPAPGAASGYGEIEGVVTARLCPVDWKEQRCQDFSASFTTDLQFDGEIPVK